MNDIMIVPDLSKDERFSNFPYVSGDPNLRFYCGMPLIDPEGHAVGSLCAVDFEPGNLEFGGQEALRRLAREVMTQLELRRSLVTQRKAVAELENARVMVQEEQEKSDRLLLNILPEKIAGELRKNDHVSPAITIRRLCCLLILRILANSRNAWSLKL